MSRVLCVITSMGSGGAERQLSGLAKMLKDTGHTVEVIWYAQGDFYKGFLIENKICFKELYAKHSLAKVLNIAKEIRKYKPQTVISFLTGPNVITSLLKVLGYRYHLIVSDRNTLQCLTLKYKLCFYLFKWADYIVPNSYSEGLFIKKNFPQLSPKVNVITNFTDTDYFIPSESRSHFNEIPNILIVARVSEQKNVICFLKAVSLVKQRGLKVRFKWYGDSYDQEYRQACFRLLKQLDIDDYIIINSSTDKVLHEYQNADAFCLPSLYEGFPNVVCEAMSCGLPVLCSNICDNPNIVEDGVNGYLFNPNSENDIADTIAKYLFNMLPNADQIARINREKIQYLCSRNAFLHNYLKILK